VEDVELFGGAPHRKHVLEMGHSTHGGHMGGKRTKERIAYTFYWPSMYDDCREFVKTCKVCKLKKRVTYRDHVPIQFFLCAFMVATALTQTGPNGNELPFAFSSAKLTQTQCKWSTIEKEAYAALFALRKYRNWLFGSKVTLYSDHNPLLLNRISTKECKTYAMVIGFD